MNSIKFNLFYHQPYLIQGEEGNTAYVPFWHRHLKPTFSLTHQNILRPQVLHVTLLSKSPRSFRNSTSTSYHHIGMSALKYNIHSAKFSLKIALKTEIW